MGVFIGSPPVSAVTRCPTCGTAFRISDAQLAARSGQARCGRCGEVFDARAAVLADPTLPAAPVTQPRDADGRRSRPGPPSRAFADTLPGAVPARRSSWAWWIASLVALAGLAAQFAFHFRGEIALLWPAAKPALERACAELGCDVPLPKRAELMSIEASDLQAYSVDPGVMVLSATLRNRAAFPQQLPSLELTLTNARDEAVARRVLYSGDYLGRPANRDAGFAGNSEIAVRVFIEAPALKPTGYRLYLFYP
jgi:predicted Zn finger-like uncharacterized protein